MASTCRGRCRSWAQQRTEGASQWTGSRRAESQSHRTGWVDSEAKAATNQGSARLDWKLTSIRIGREKVWETESDRVDYWCVGKRS
jgi:hypothetical protein